MLYEEHSISLTISRFRGFNHHRTRECHRLELQASSMMANGNTRTLSVIHML